MPNFRFMHAHFPDPKLSKHEITLRLSAHRRKLLAARMGIHLPRQDDGGVEDELDGRQSGEPLDVAMLDKTRAAIERRAALINKRHLAPSGLSHLKPKDANKLERVRDGVRLAKLAPEHPADELAADLHAEFPWMGPATDAVWHGMRRSVRAGDPGLRLPPTRFAQRSHVWHLLGRQRLQLQGLVFQHLQALGLGHRYPGRRRLPAIEPARAHAVRAAEIGTFRAGLTASGKQSPRSFSDPPRPAESR